MTQSLPQAADREATYSIDECDSAFVRDFVSYKGSPDPFVVWRAAWQSAMRHQAKAGASQAHEQAVFSKTPREPWRVGSWIGNDNDAWQAIVGRLNTLNDFWDRSALLDARRMFLLLVAEEREEIDAANAAAYHGDVDGDFDY